MEKSYTTAQVAEILNLHKGTIRLWTEQGKFPNSFKIGRTWRITEQDINSLLEEMKNEKVEGSNKVNEPES